MDDRKEKDPSKHDLKQTARTLRHNMTKEEKRLWYDFLKRLPFSVNRQKQLQGYIVDFLIPSAKTVIELDGSQHFTEKGRSLDSERELKLNEMGFSVLRYSNDDVNNTYEGVCIDIMKHLRVKGINVGWDQLKPSEK